MTPSQDGPRHPFPTGLLAALRAQAAEGAVWRLGLWNGETVGLRRILAETEDGLLGELRGVPGADQPPTVVAVPWDAIARIEAAPETAHRARPGFRAE